MKRLLSLFVFLLFSVAAKPVQGASTPIHVFLIVPSDYASSSIITAANAVPVIQSWTGSPTAAACPAGQTDTCTLESWWNREVGKVFDYQVDVVNTSWTIADLALGGQPDACGYYGLASADGVRKMLFEERKYDIYSNSRNFIVVLGAGGSALHIYQTVHGGSVGVAQLGDWGIGRAIYGDAQWQQMTPCDPLWGTPAGGYGLEALGAMGANPCDCLFMGAVLSSTERRLFTNNNKDFLRNP